MDKLLGANWSTTLSGFVFTLAVAISTNPKLIDFLPDSWRSTVVGIAGLIAVLAGGTFAYQVKSKNVTGGTVQQTVSGKVAEPTTQNLVDQTVIASIKSGDPGVTFAQRDAVRNLPIQ